MVAARRALSGKTSGKVTGKTSGKTSDAILLAIADNAAVTIPELAESLGVSPRTIERNLYKLQEEGRLRRVGPAKGGRWELI